MTTSDEWPQVLFEEDAIEYQEHLMNSTRELTDVLFAWLAAKELLNIQEGFWILWMATYRIMNFIIKGIKGGPKDGTGSESPPEEIR